MSDTHNNLLSQVEQYIQDNEKFSDKGNKAAGTRARKALMEITKLCKDRRKEIQEAKNNS
jgi:hypothetical protein